MKASGGSGRFVDRIVSVHISNQKVTIAYEKHGLKLYYKIIQKRQKLPEDVVMKEKGP